MDAADSTRMGVGERLGAEARESMDVPIEAHVDAVVVAWFPPYAAAVRAIRADLEREARTHWAAAVEARIAATPSARDVLAPSPWRSALRVLGFVAAASAAACILLSLGIMRGSALPVAPSTTAVVVAVSGVAAAACLGASVLRPSRMGTPSALAGGASWIGAVGVLASAGVLRARIDEWSASTGLWWVAACVAGVALLVLAVIVTVARRAAHRAGVIDERGVRALRVETIAAALAHAIDAVEKAWATVDPAVRAEIEHERGVALDAIEQRLPGRLDGTWMRAVPPGVRGLPHVADRLHATMMLGDATIVDREAGAARPRGRFATEARRRAGEPTG